MSFPAPYPSKNAKNKDEVMNAIAMPSSLFM